MDGWTKCNLGDVVNLKRGYDLPKRDRRDGPFPIVSSSGTTGFHDTQKVSGPGVVTGRYGTLGEVFFIETDFWPLNTTLYVQDFKGNDPRFISFFLKTLNLASQNSAGAVPGVNRNALHLLPVEIPPLPAQRKIADILSAYDDLIENSTRRIAILEEMAQRLYQEWFVHFRYPGHENVPLVDSALGLIPEGWGVKRLFYVAEEVRRPVQPSELDPDTPYVGLEHIPRKSITLREWGSIDSVTSTKLGFTKGDILFGKIRPYFHKVVVAPFDGVTSSDTIVICPRSSEWFGLLLGCVSSTAFVEHATMTSQGTKMPRANWNVLKNYGMAVPPKHLLQCFSDQADCMVLNLGSLTRRNLLLAKTSDLMLPRLVNYPQRTSASEDADVGVK